MQTWVYAVFALLLTGQPIAAQCDDRTNEIAASMDAISATISKVENPPPEIASYLKSELAAAQQQNNLTRYNMAASHKYFHAYEFRKEWDRILDNYNRFKEAKEPNRRALIPVDMLSAYPDLYNAFRDYATYDANRNPRVLSQKEVDGLTFMFIFFKGGLVATVECLVHGL